MLAIGFFDIIVNPKDRFFEVALFTIGNFEAARSLFGVTYHEGMLYLRVLWLPTFEFLIKEDTR